MRTPCSDETHRRGGRPRLDPALERKGFWSTEAPTAHSPIEEMWREAIFWGAVMEGVH